MNSITVTLMTYGDSLAATELAELLEKRGDLDRAMHALRAPADAGYADVAAHVVRVLADRGDLDRLPVRADAGDHYAATVLADRGDLDGLRVLIDVGHPYVAWRLQDLTTKQGRGDEAAQLRRFGLNPDGSIAHALTARRRGANELSAAVPPGGSRIREGI